MNGTSPRSGILQINYNGRWGSVCDSFNFFGTNEGGVSCRQLGYPALESKRNNPTNPFTWITEVFCYGDEGRLIDCDYYGWDVPCSSGVVELTCEGTIHTIGMLVCSTYNNNFHISTLDNTITQCQSRLLDGDYTWQGRVEINYNNTWGSVCDDVWDVEDANVVCRQLGFVRAISAPRFSPFGQSSGPIWLDQLACTGTEASLCECPGNSVGVHDCSHFEDAGAVCQGSYTAL